MSQCPNAFNWILEIEDSPFAPSFVLIYLEISFLQEFPAYEDRMITDHVINKQYKWFF